MKVAAIIQARLGSTRLPGKILKKVMDKTLLEYQIERIRKAKNIDEIIIATTVKETDDTIIEMCKKLGLSYYRGSEDDVLSRYYEAAVKFEVDVIVRITSDCPIIDPKVIDKVIQTYLDHQEYIDYVSNTLIRSYPRGLDTEVFSFKTLERTHKMAVLPSHREHVTAYIYHHPEEFNLENVSDEQDFSHHRWTVDTIEDFRLISNIISHLYIDKKDFSYEDVLDVMNRYPEWYLINHHIEQKKI